MARFLRYLVYSLAVALLSLNSARGQQPPDVGYVFPPSVPAGSSIEVRLGGYDWTPDMQFFLRDERVELKVLGPPGEMLHPGPPHWFGHRSQFPPFSVPREVPARLTVPADMPPGRVRWQAANANGGTAAGEFIVGRGNRPQVVEAESDHGVAPASHRRQPAGSNPEADASGSPAGDSAALRRQPPAEDQSDDRLQTLPGPPFVLCGRLEKKEEVDHYTFSVKEGGLVTCQVETGGFGFRFNPILKVHDSAGRLVADAADTRGVGLTVTFAVRAGEQYRLTLHDLDYRGNRSLVYRLVTTRGPRVVATIPAAGQRGERQTVELLGYGVASGKAELESVRREIAFPEKGDSLAYRLATPFGTAPVFNILLSDLRELTESDSVSEKPDQLQPPVAATGVLDQSHAEDRYHFEVKKGDVWSLSVQAEQFGSPVDPTLRISGPDGKLLAQADDGPDTLGAELLFEAPADGRYTVSVGDRAGNASRRAIYRLAIAAPQPDFEVVIPDHLDVPMGEKTKLQVEVRRKDGFTGAIDLKFEGLPDGLSADPVEISSKKNKVKITVECAEDATSYASLAMVRATASSESRPQIEKTVKLLLAPVMPPRAGVTPVYPDAGRTVHRGATYPAPVIVERLQGFDGDVRLELAAHPDRVRQGISGEPLTVPPGIERVDYPLFLPEWVHTDLTSRIILNTVVQVADPKGNTRHLVNKMTDRITMNVEGEFLSISKAPGEYRLRPGESIEIPVRVSRSAVLKEKPVTLTLDAGEDLGGLLQSEPVDVPAGTNEARLRVKSSASRRLIGEQQLIIKGTAWQDKKTAWPNPKLPVVSQTKVLLEFVE